MSSALQPPPAEVTITTELVSRLVATQYPEFSGLHLRRVSGGWDNELYRLGDRLCVRIPRRSIAVTSIRNEWRWLRRVAHQIPYPTPAPLYYGEPDLGFDWPWLITPWLPGLPAETLSRSRRDAWARDLASAVAGLHQPAPEDAPANPFRGMDLVERDHQVRTHLEGLKETGTVSPADGVRLATIWERGLQAPSWNGPLVWIHADLHAGNLLVNEDKPHQLAAIIDFGDLCAGDPACDLAAMWRNFTSTGRKEFAQTYQQRRPGFASQSGIWDRAHAWATLMVVSVMTHSGLTPNDRAVTNELISTIAVQD